MRQLQLVPMLVYGTLGYVLGVLLAVLPFVLGFDGEDTATIVCVVLGVLTLLVTLLGKGPASAASLIPAVIVEGYGYLLGLVLMLLPFVLGLRDERRATLVFVALGLGWFVVTLAARFPRFQADATPDTSLGSAAQDTPPQGDDTDS